MWLISEIFFYLQFKIFIFFTQDLSKQSVVNLLSQSFIISGLTFSFEIFDFQHIKKKRKKSKTNKVCE